MTAKIKTKMMATISTETTNQLLNFFKQGQQAGRAKVPAFGQEEVENFLQSDLAKDNNIEEEKEEVDDAEIQS